MDEYWTTAEWAKQARTAESTARYWRSIGYGPQGFRVGRRVLYDANECRNFLRAQRDQQQKATLPPLSASMSPLDRLQLEFARTGDIGTARQD